MQKTILISWFAATSLLGLLAQAEENHIKTRLQCPGTAVLGFPVPLTLTTWNTSKDIPHSMFRMDVVTETDGWYAKGIMLEFADSDGSVTNVGTLVTGRPDIEFTRGPSRFFLMGGEHATTTFDINQLLLNWGPGNKLPSAGHYKVRAVCHHGNAASERNSIVLRAPTATEQHYLASLAKQGIKVQWFPAIIKQDSIEMPPSGDLPEETAQLCDYIAALRLALRNPAAALDAFGARSDWGFYGDPVRELEYECTIAVHGKESEQATSKRAELLANGLAGRITRVDKGGGLLTRFGTTGQSE